MSRLLVSVDLGGTNSKAAAGRPDGEIVVSRSEPTRAYDGPPGVLKRVGAAVAAIGKEVGEPIDAVRIAVPGLIELNHGVTKFLPNLPSQWRDAPVVRTLSEDIRCPVHLLNDPRMATR